MKKKIEIEIDVPDVFDAESMAIFSLLTPKELLQLKGVAIGMLMGSGRYSPEELAAISAKCEKL